MKYFLLLLVFLMGCSSRNVMSEKEFAEYTKKTGKTYWEDGSSMDSVFKGQETYCYRYIAYGNFFDIKFVCYDKDE